MMKFGEKRINPRHIVTYEPSITSESSFIVFKLSTGVDAKIIFDNEKERDDMLALVDKYLISFDDGIVIMPDIPNFPFILGGPSEEGPGGLMQ